jgi:hypothetical protein
MVLTKEIIVDFTEGEGEQRTDIAGRVVMKRLSYDEHNALETDIAPVKLMGNVPQVVINSQAMKSSSIMRSVVSSSVKKTTYMLDKTSGELVPSVTPIDLTTIAGIKELPREVGDQLFMTYTELNSIGAKKDESSS